MDDDAKQWNCAISVYVTVRMREWRDWALGFLTLQTAIFQCGHLHNISKESTATSGRVWIMNTGERDSILLILEKI